MELGSLSAQLSARFIARARRFKLASSVVRAALLIGAAAVAGFAQFAEFPPEGPTAWRVAGIIATGLVALGAVFSAIVDEDASEELALARQAVEEARLASESLQFLDRYEREFARAVELYQAMNIMRGAIEQSSRIATVTEDGAAASVLKAAERSLSIAMGFEQADQWTICIYRAEPDTEGRTWLRCVAHSRAIECKLEEARKWEAGTGIAGSAFANRNEVVVPDLQSPGLRAVFGTSANVRKPSDPDRYRSMAAVPILLDGASEPWGVATATNDRVDHFSPSSGEGVPPAEAVRSLANMAALAVAVHRSTRS